jgi:predicted cupin superfamily sugar epimerase
MFDPMIRDLVERLGMKPHPEGGYYAETYRARELVETPRGRRPASTAIYFLLPAGTKSCLHRIQSDEAWHFYMGGPLVVEQIAPDGSASRARLGPGIAAGESLQHVVPAGHWFGAAPYPGTKFSLVGCTVAPGFDFADFELGKKADLLRQYPQAKDVIERLT